MSDPLAAIDLEAAAATPGAWLELAVAADHEAVEAVSEILSRAAPGGTSVEPAFELVEEGLAARVDLERPAQVRAHLPVGDVPRVRAAVDRAERELGHLQAFGLRPIGDLRAAIVHEDDWANAWKSHFPVLRVGRRIVIRPTWRRHRRQPDDVVLALDPGMAFGTGLHPTTRLCLAALESLSDRGVLDAGGADGGRARVLDVGSGSGILSIAAGLLVRLADGLVEDLRPGGTLVASGIFANRESDVVEAFDGRGLRVVQRLEEGDWIAVVLERPG